MMSKTEKGTTLYICIFYSKSKQDIMRMMIHTLKEKARGQSKQINK